MKKTTFSHSLLSLCLLFLISILGGGNAVNAQSYQLVTSTAELVSGDKYLIVNKDKTKALGTQTGNYRAAVDVTFDAKGNISTVPAGACVLELQAQDGSKWAFYDASNKGFLYAASSKSNHLKTQNALDDNGKATVNITSEGVATIKFTGANSRNLLQYNSNQTWFSCYSTSQQAVSLYHYVASTATGTENPNISYSSSSLTIAANGTLTQPTLNNPNKVTIKSYSSSNPSVATVTDKGVIALAGGTGTATITATSQADATYKEGTATYTLTVFGAPEITPESGEYSKSVDVVISATDAAALWYTTDGSEPMIDNAAATKVTEFPVNLNLGLGEHTVKAITAYDAEGTILSNVETRTYTVSDMVFTTVEKSSPFTDAKSGKLDDVISYTTAQEDSTTPPALNSGNIRLYQSNTGGYGGSITITAIEGYEIKSVTIGTARSTTYSYTLDGSAEHSAKTDLAANEKATLGGLSNQSVSFYCESPSGSSNRFDVNYISVSYVLKAGAVATPSITFSETETSGAPIDVTITATSASYIWYTTDGTDPTAAGVKPIEAEGESTSFTLSEAGNYTIMAIALNDNLDYSQLATATCVINKPTPGLAKMKYKKVTSNDDIVDGGVYIVVCESKNVALESIDADQGYKADIELVDETYNGAVNETSVPCEIQLNKIDENIYSIYVISGGGYLSVVSAGSRNITLTPGVNNDWARWSISCSDGNTTIGCVDSASEGYSLQYNASGTMFRMYDSAQTPIQLYKKTFDLSVNANTAGYATAYTAFPYVMPASADGYIVTETAEGATIKAKKKYPAGAEVPAYAPLLIKNAEPGGVTLNPVVLGKTVEAYPYAEENLLHGTRLASDGVTTDVDGSDNYYYYKLSYKLDAGNPVPGSYGFYRGKADGSAFVMKNTLTAYLALPKSSGQVNNLRISIDNEDGPTTGIQANRFPADNMPQSVYTLSGVRVNAEGNRLPKGIYIVNGKKVVIK